ncbi:MAG: hypothetical protein COV47_00540 [Candidatus Diapherotrites archaeon CG11_big_fil_rev_8_21_14_0_20_37_9]|nr:MAG: hypothetical protein COV47_00540 [Candidatus Diapherotrites archaeon CG11_big_fil_rev_8_21_14_0_20_37_9]
MLVVKDSMVLIHLAKITLLEKSCSHFSDVIIPQKVFDEVVVIGKKKEYPDAFLVEEIIQKGKISVKTLKNKDFEKRANQFNIFGGEAEVVALYWQEKANLIACDDDNVRNKKEMLELNIIGTPSILLSLYRKRKITKEKFEESINKLRKIGWFSNQVLDAMLLEVHKNG